MNKVASILEVPPMRVYEVATFYTMYNRRVGLCAPKLELNVQRLCDYCRCFENMKIICDVCGRPVARFQDLGGRNTF